MAFGLEKIDRQNLERERSIVLSGAAAAATGKRSRFGHLMRALFPRVIPTTHRRPSSRTSRFSSCAMSQRFMQEYYRPDNATLAIVGDFDAVRTRAMIERYFAPIVPARVPIARRAAPAVELRGVETRAGRRARTPGRNDVRLDRAGDIRTERKSLKIALDVLAARLRHKLMIPEALAIGVFCPRPMRSAQRSCRP
jgi:hypothetical protein